MLDTFQEHIFTFGTEYNAAPGNINVTHFYSIMPDQRLVIKFEISTWL